MAPTEEAPGTGGWVGVDRAGIVSLAALAATLLLAIALGFTLACGSEEQDSLEDRWALLGVPEAEFVFIGDLTPDEQASIRRELKVAQTLFADHFGAVTSDFVAYVSTDLEALNERLAADKGEDVQSGIPCGGMALDEYALVLSLDGCTEAKRAQGGPLAHEYFHILQMKAGLDTHKLEGTDLQPWFPWLVEGPAVYAEGLADVAQGRVTTAAYRQAMRLRVSSSVREPLPRNLSLASADYAAYAYHAGFLATEWLVERAGPETLLEFFRLGRPQEAAFEAAFGMTLDEFHDSFEEHRLEVAPPFEWEVAGMVVDPDGQPIPELLLVTVVRIKGTPWVVGGIATDPKGNFALTAPGSGYTIAITLHCLREDGAYEEHFVGEWGADGFVANNDGQREPSKQGAAPFRDGERDRTDLVIELPETHAALSAKHCPDEDG